MHRDKEAEAAFREAIALDPSFLEAHYQLGNLLASANATIQAGLAAADSENTQVYRDAANHYIDAIRQADARIEAAYAPIPPDRRRIITTHDAFGYYGARYGIDTTAKPEVVKQALQSLAPRGTLVALGLGAAEPT